ncbi:MAG TPA: dTDP-4-dehydrorhamnose 3,5-epimerase [Puia sp.]|jgi:dTDP-4-dehydrorhamnose 3,5-epimerase|nr:dTDP-4-dehydrorhamnose 3,5-epimerase [Puia sp.]
MPFRTTDIPGLLIFEPAVYTDERGYFFESYNEEVFRREGIANHFVQDNQSFSGYGVIRGLHYQLEPYAQCKLLRVLQGAILDIAVDIRVGSPTYGRHIAIELSAENKWQFLIPPGFAHGFSVLTPTAEVAYKCDAFYKKESEAGIRFDDPVLDIDWRIPADKRIVSAKDLALPLLADCRNTFKLVG